MYVHVHVVDLNFFLLCEDEGPIKVSADIYSFGVCALEVSFCLREILNNYDVCIIMYMYATTC